MDFGDAQNYAVLDRYSQCIPTYQRLHRKTTMKRNKLIKSRCVADTAKYFSDKVINRWNMLNQQTVDASCTVAVDASSINRFKSRLSRIRDDQMGFFMD